MLGYLKLEKSLCELRHSQLWAAYRLSANRDFFEADYKTVDFPR